MKRIKYAMFYPLFFIVLALIARDPLLKILDTGVALLFFSADITKYLLWKVRKK